MVWGLCLLSGVRRLHSQSVWQKIISEPIKCISFNFQLYVALDMTQCGNWQFWKKKKQQKKQQQQKKTRFLIFFLWFYSFLVNIRPYENQHFNTLLLPQSLLNYFKLLLNVLLNGPHKSTGLDFWSLRILILTEFSSFLNTGPYRSENFKTLLLLEITFELFQTSVKFSLQRTSQSTVLDFWILSFRFVTNFGNSPFFPMEKPKNLNYLENERP